MTIDDEIDHQLKSMGLQKGGSDELYLHALESIGAIIQHNNRLPLPKLESAKTRIFWKALREIANHEMGREENVNHELNAPLSWLLDCFPEKKMRKDGRMWLPMHFAMSVPNIALDDIQTLFESDPNSISRECNSFLGFTPCQLAVMMKDPNLALFDRLKVYDPGFAASVNFAFRTSTPLHLAADHSNSVVVIKELIRMYPEALVMKDIYRDYPI